MARRGYAASIAQSEVINMMKTKLLAAAVAVGLGIVGLSQSAHAVFINFDALASRRRTAAEGCVT